jgi:hypothetical protein
MLRLCGMFMERQPWLARSAGLELLRLFMDLAYYRAFGRLWALGLGCLGWLGYDRGIEG